MSRRLWMAVLFPAVLAFLLLTVPANHSEAEDAYFYARMTEQGTASQLFHAHHLLYLPLMKTLFAAAGSLGYSGRALPLLIGFSMFSGALAVCLFSVLAGRGRSGIIFALAMLFSYGFWRYSTAAEIYIPVTALSLLALYCARRSEHSSVWFWGCTLSAAAALLMHVAAWPLVFAAIPFYLVATRRPQRAALYLTAVLTITAVVYIIAVSGPGLTVFSDAQALRETLVSPRAWLKGAAAWSQNVLSGNFLFAIEPVAEKINAFFPYHMLQEEVFMGSAAPAWIRVAAPVSFLSVVSALLAVFLLSLKNAHRVFAAEDRVWPVTVLLWLGGTAATAFFFEPANPEMWICALAPFWLMISFLWSQSRHSPGWICAAALLLLLHNAAGGMSLVRSPRGDYCRQKAAEVIQQTRENDLILSADSHSFITFLQYRSPAGVLDVKSATVQMVSDAIKQTDGRVFVFDDVINPLPPVRRRAPGSVRELERIAAWLNPGLEAVDAGPGTPARLYLFNPAYGAGEEKPQ